MFNFKNLFIMKKLFYFIVLSTSFYLSNAQTTGKISTDELEKFKNDVLTQNLKKNFYTLIDASSSNNDKLFNETVSSGILILKDLNKKFTEAKVNAYLELLSSGSENSVTDSYILGKYGTHDGSPCTLNQDGSVYWGACSTWEAINAYIGILANCGWVSVPSTSLEEIRNFVRCEQSQICKHC